MKDLTDLGDALEADLAKRSAPLSVLTALPSPSEIVDRVAASLPQGSALLELIAYVNRPSSAGTGTSGPRYLALVLRPDGDIRAVDLGAAEPIDRAASRLRSALANRDATFLASAQELHQLAFQPLLPRSATPAACSSLPMGSSASSPSRSSTTGTASSWTPSTSPTSPRARTCCPAPRA